MLTKKYMQSQPILKVKILKKDLSLFNILRSEYLINRQVILMYMYDFKISGKRSPIHFSSLHLRCRLPQLRKNVAIMPDGIVY